MKDIQICSNFDIVIYSHQLLGLIRIYGNAAICFKGSGFPRTSRSILMITVEGNRIALDTGDALDFEQSALEWCQIYAKVNIDETKPPTLHENKIVILGPHFPVQLLNPLRAMGFAISTYMRRPHAQFREHFANYYRQWRYLRPEAEYIPSISMDDYIFSSSSIWKKEQHANDTRAHFIRAVRQMSGVRFEGGLIPRKHNDVSGYEDVLSHGRYAIKDYIEKTQKSAIVFNTPAVKQNHSWKLGEYMAMGKAILSVPIVRPIPKPFEHGVHMHFVDPTPDAILEGVRYLMENKAYRLELGENARSYYEQNLRPEVAMRRIISYR